MLWYPVVDPEKVGRVDGLMLAVTKICLNFGRHQRERAIWHVTARLQDISDPPVRLHLDFDARYSCEWGPSRCSSPAPYKVTCISRIYDTV
jgi:hypothetical protein